MKRLFLYLLLSAAVLSSYGQKSLSNSPTKSQYTFIYKLTDKEAFGIPSRFRMRQRRNSEEKPFISDDFFHTLVDSARTKELEGKKDKLPFGNYILVTPEANVLRYEVFPVSNVHFRLLNNAKDFQCVVTDLKGNVITGAEVWVGSKKILNDPQTKLYTSGFIGKSGKVTVRYQGQSSFYNYDIWKPEVKPSFFNTLFKKKTEDPYRRPKVDKRTQNKYLGYVVFNKPKFKPLDTVKFKAYFVTGKGSAIGKKAMRLELFEGDFNPDAKGIILDTLQPYREGGYESSLILQDSLALKLDKHYTLVFSELRNKKWVKAFSKSFRYEDYELKQLNFNVRLDKRESRRDRPSTVYLKATDENGLSVADGRVELVVMAESISEYHSDKIFVKDTLWKTSVIMDPLGETKLVIPDSIFPDADLRAALHFQFLNSNNESAHETKYLNFITSDQQFKSEVKGDSLYISYLKNGVPARKNITITSVCDFEKTGDSLKLSLPGALKINPMVLNYSLVSEDGFSGDIYMQQLLNPVTPYADQGKDSLKIAVDNKAGIPFWYTIFSADQILQRGYTIRLDTIMKHTSEKTAHIELKYLWGGLMMEAQVSAYYNKKGLKVALQTPEVVYPGQTVKVDVQVSDINNKPVPGTDVTAYAATSKFSEHQDIYLPVFGNRFIGRKLKPMTRDFDLALEARGKLDLDWDKWEKKLGLDTIEYYKFSQTKDMYRIDEDSRDSMAVVAPFLTTYGNIQPVHIVYIDGIPVYFSQADQLQHYAFRVSPGRHTLMLRSEDRLVVLEDQYFQKGKKAIISISTDLSNKKALVTLAKSRLSAAEADVLNNYMIRIQNNFGEEKAIVLGEKYETLLNPPSYSGNRSNLLAGPFKENYLYLNSGTVKQVFAKEPGYVYSFTADLLRQKSIPGKYTFDTSLASLRDIKQDYKDQPLTSKDIDSIWNEFYDSRSMRSMLFNNYSSYGPSSGKMITSVSFAKPEQQTSIKNVLVYRTDQPDFLHVYPGFAYRTAVLEQGTYKVLYLFKNNTYFIRDQIIVRPGGTNYYRIKDPAIKKADSISIPIDVLIKSVITSGYKSNMDQVRQRISEILNRNFSDPSVFRKKVSGIVRDQKTMLPLTGARVSLKGFKQISVKTNKQGAYSITVPEKSILIFELSGYEDKADTVAKGQTTILLKKRQYSSDETLLERYKKQSQQDGANLGYGFEIADVPLGNVEELLQGKVAGLNIQNNTGAPGLRGSVNIRGLSSISTTGSGGAIGGQPLMIVDGLPYSGTMGSLDQNTIAEITILKDAEATALYGSSGANGVILIKTNKANEALSADGSMAATEQSMRRNFSDYAIWQPKLITDESGKASFTVKFPDDITSWSAHTIAMNDRQQSGMSSVQIKSFKSLSANFVSPQFALAGDEISVIGKLMNYTSKTESAKRRFAYNGKELLSSDIQFKNAHIDTVKIIAAAHTPAQNSGDDNQADSLSFEYSMLQNNGYFDGELRKIPVFKTGVTETKGYFDALLKDTTVSYDFDARLGPVTLRAEASVFPVLLDEMEKLSQYEYLCNEQLASKLKSLLLEKKVRIYLNQNFKKEKLIREILKKLKDNRRAEGTWGWWQSSPEEMWISLHSTEALLQAEKQGYSIQLNKELLYKYLVAQLATKKDHDRLYTLRLIHMLSSSYYLNDWVLQIEAAAAKTEADPLEKTLYEKLHLLLLRQQAGMDTDVKWLLSQKKHTMFGSSYWGEANRNFWDNSIQNTLLAYQILKGKGGYENELDGIGRYFLEQRKDGQWRNTYESALILETILPDLLKGTKGQESAALTINNEHVNNFPYTKTVSPAKLSVSKKGSGAVYFTAYQQFNNPKPEKASKDFSVKTWFEQQNVPVKSLKAGMTAMLKVEVEVRADADYVMIEIPIPAGCSYENKPQSYWGIETHREYFKHKTSIFCSKLKQGKYTFNIQLMPRYSGAYNLNPAKAELMYFPVFYGREEMKKININ